MRALSALLLLLTASLAGMDIAAFGPGSFDQALGPALELRAETESWVAMSLLAWADRSLGPQFLDAEALDGDGQPLQRSQDLYHSAPFAPAGYGTAIFKVPAGTRALRFRVRGHGPAVGHWELRVPQAWALESTTESIGLEQTRLTLRSGADSIGLERSGRHLGDLVLPSGWVLQGRLEHRESGEAGERRSGSRWLLQGPGGQHGILQAAASVAPKDPSQARDSIPLTLTLQSHEPAAWALTFVAAADGTWLLPFNQGLQVPQQAVAGLSPSYDLDLRAGHFLSMPAWGWSQGGQGLRFWAPQPADQALRLNLGHRSIGWVIRPTLGAWQEAQTLWISGTDGSAAAWSQGLRQAHRDLRDVGPPLKPELAPGQVERLAGAVNIHYWKRADWWSNEPRPQALAAEMRAAGLDKVLWSQSAAPEAVEAMNAQGWLTGSYENFQDVYPSDTPLNWANKEGWPEQAVMEAGGWWRRGWPAKADGKTYYSGVRSSRAAVGYVQAALDRLKARGQGAVFLDTTTASGPVEDWDPSHPMSRGMDLRFKRGQLAYGASLGLVVGSESGHDGALGAARYFEGMQSPWIGRFDDSGYDLHTIREPTPAMLKWNLSPRYRAPLFDLAWHDSYVGYEYWGDAANRLPEHWRRKDLFSVLYAQPQLWILDEARWREQKDAALKSYRTWSPVVRHLFGHRMTDWRVLDAKGDRQETRWDDGSVIRVDFGKDRFELEGPVGASPK